MILARLFRALLDRGVTLVFTSNVPPKGLYRDGLQRRRFLPAITMLEKHTEVIAVDAGTDYRLRRLAKVSLYLDSASPQAQKTLTHLFEVFAGGSGSTGGAIEVAERDIAVIRESENAVWFEFTALCEGPRGKDFNMRWVASMVADVHRILTRGGVFMYPWDKREPEKPGKLRLLYEANPMSFLIEQAGGAATNGTQRILDITPGKLHERVSVVLGSKNEVDRVTAYHREAA